MPSVSAQLRDIQELILPLIIPPAAAFTTPLLQNFAASHDPLMESDILFTAKPDLANAQIELNAAMRALVRNAAAEEEVPEVPDGTGPEAKLDSSASDVKRLLDGVRQGRLRSKLRGLSGGGRGDEASRRSQASIIRASRLRKEMFDREIDKEESEALEDFKRKLRESVLQT
ncbi:hypothetical protein DRE_01867 [Drechslerella stenobrocha 248]|uniref:Uncharacterized protein n=1 Tax=Drechslerella stenobrocha 248 TaxID=1043628 RepID=W7IHC9_9PEZI|nr:hypothetical protein DRE_01867 [Drechslerella stenobrocha 248]